MHQFIDLLAKRLRSKEIQVRRILVSFEDSNVASFALAATHAGSACSCANKSPAVIRFFTEEAPN